MADFELVTPSYFKTFGAHLVQGRFLEDSDRLGGAAVIVVNRSFQDRFLQGKDALTQRILLPDNNHDQPPTEWQIVGVFQDIANGEHLAEKAQPQMIGSFWQAPEPHIGLAVHSFIDPALISSPVGEAVKQSLPGYTLTEVSTMQQTMDDQFAGDRFGMLLFAGFAALALLLAALGIYGVMAFAVTQRSHEMGLRMALGAQRGDVILLFLRDGMKLAILGLSAGLAGVFTLGHFMRAALYEVGTVDLASLASVAITLLTVAVLASFIPARRSAKVDPMIALRRE